MDIFRAYQAMWTSPSLKADLPAAHRCLKLQARMPGFFERRWGTRFSARLQILSSADAFGQIAALRREHSILCVSSGGGAGAGMRRGVLW
eukprot:6212788-Pleurochrysis_carterae.AAC.1